MSTISGIGEDRRSTGFRMWITNPWAETRFLWVVGIAYVAWTDTRSGSQDIRFTRFRVTPPPRALNDRFEPNDTSAAATNLGTINLLRVFPRLNAAAGDADYYRLTAGADGTLSLAVTGRATLQVVVTDANGNNPTSGNPLRDTSGRTP